MNTKKILVPYNFTRQDEKVLNYVFSTYVDQKNIIITLLHLYTPLTKYSQLKRGKVSSPVVTTTGEKTGRKITSIMDKEYKFNNLKSIFLEKGFHEENIDFSFAAKSKSISNDIVSKIKEEDYDVVILSYSSKKGRMFFVESIHERILNDLKDKIIIIVT